MYWSTGIQYLILSSSIGPFLYFGEQNLKKYHEESTKVSNVSVSRVAFFPLGLCIVFFHVGCFSNGLPL